MIPVLMVSIPVIAVVFNGLQKLARLRIEEAQVRSGSDNGDVEVLRAEVQELRQELSEVQERLDFAERLLARNSERDKLPPPG